MDLYVTLGAGSASAPAGFEAAIGAAVAFIDSAFASPITVSLTFDYAPLEGSIGASDTTISTYSYASVVAALSAAAAGDSALTNEVLPSADPFGGGTLTLATADARQLGLTTLAPSSDGTVTLDSSVSWDWNDGVAVSGEFNAVTVLIHEITETLGRIAGSDGDLLRTPLALFRYSSPGVIDTSNKAGGYLSLNGGVSDLVAMGNAGGDIGDYDVNVDPFGYAVAGDANSVTALDLDAMEAVGYNLNPAFHVGGGANVTLTDLGLDTATFYESGANWDTVHSNLFANVTLWNDQASVFGDDVTVTFEAFSAGVADSVSLYNSGEGVDTILGSNGTVTLVGNDGFDVDIEGGSDAIYFDGASKIEAELSQTDGNWDTVTGSNGVITLDDAQTAIFGGNDIIQDYFTAPAGSEVSFYATDNDWDAMEVSNAVIILNAAQLSNYAEDDVIYFNGSTANAVSLYDSGTTWTAVWGSNGTVILDGSNAAIHGGGDTIYFNTTTLSNSAPYDSVSLYDTDGSWDTVWGSTGTVILNSAQASVVGGSDTIYLDGSTQDAVSLYATSGAWDTVQGSNGAVSLVSAQASVIGGGDYLYLSGTGSAVSLYSTAGTADTVSGPGSVTLNNAQASLASGGETIYLNGTADVLSFAAHYGQDVISGFVATDSLKFSATDWSSFAALQASGDIVSSGSNTLIKLDANDMLTLLGVSTSSLTAANA